MYSFAKIILFCMIPVSNGFLFTSQFKYHNRLKLVVNNYSSHNDTYKRKNKPNEYGNLLAYASPIKRNRTPTMLIDEALAIASCSTWCATVALPVVATTLALTAVFAATSDAAIAAALADAIPAAAALAFATVAAAALPAAGVSEPAAIATVAGSTTLAISILLIKY